jgi:hypothetical protein
MDEQRNHTKKNQVGRGPDDSTTATSILDSVSAATTPITNAVSSLTSQQSPDNGSKNTGGILGNITNMFSGSSTAAKPESKAETEVETVEDLNKQPEEVVDTVNPDGDDEADETVKTDEVDESEAEAKDETKTLLTEGLEAVRKDYARYYGVNEEDIVVSEGEDDITKTGQDMLIIRSGEKTKFSKNLKKGERVAVLFGITPGLKNGLLVYPDYETVKSASTGSEMYNASIVFDKLSVPFDDVKPGYSVKILVCYIETIVPVVEGEPLRLPYIPSISIVNYTTKKITQIDKPTNNNLTDSVPKDDSSTDSVPEDTFTDSATTYEEEDFTPIL